MNNGFIDGRYDPKVGIRGKFHSFGTHRGRVLFSVVPGISSVSASGMYVCAFWCVNAPTTSYLYLSFSDANELYLAVGDGTRSDHATGDISAAPMLASTNYEVRIEYENNWAKVFIDNIERVSIDTWTQINFDGNCIPDNYYLGFSRTGTGEYLKTTFNAPNMIIYDYKDGWRTVRNDGR